MTRYINIQERTLDYAVRIVQFCLKLQKSNEYRPLTNQLIRSGTSVGANMEEADGAISKRDFINKVSISYKEAKESVYWLKIINRAGLLGDINNLNELDYLLKEGKEVRNIVASILKNAREKSNY